MATHKHHRVAESRGGSNEDWNFDIVDEYEHALNHALDFVLFPHAPMFDFRHVGWPLLPADLQEAVRKERSRRQTEANKQRAEGGTHNWQSEKGVQRTAEYQRTRVESGTHNWKSPEHSKWAQERFSGARHWVNEKGQCKFQHEKPEGNWQNGRKWKPQ